MEPEYTHPCREKQNITSQREMPCTDLSTEAPKASINTEVGHQVVLKADDVGMFQLAKVFDVRLFLFPDLLDGHFLRVELSEKDSTLRSASQPLQLRNFLKGNLPHVCRPIGKEKACT